MDRRKFLQSSALASTALWVPQFLRAYHPGEPLSSRSGKALVVVQLSGGNDGLNTIVPYRNDEYYRKRPRLAISPDAVLPVSDELGFHPALEPLRHLYDEGQLAIINNVGYPNPDRSHFRSMDIWQTASDSDTYLSTGWLGRYLDNSCSGCAPHAALEVGDSLSLALKGDQHKGFAMSDPKRLKKSSDNPLLQKLGVAYRNGNEEKSGEHDPVAYLYKTMIDTQSSADFLHARTRSFRTRVGYPDGRFAQKLKLVAQLLTTEADIHLFYVSLSGFDTHANQALMQDRLLKQYAEGMAAFLEDLKQHRLLDDVVILTFSEFGRRVEENASRGTDHGTANNVFLMGGQLRRSGFINEGPDLSRLDQGDLIYRVDFRRIYADLLDRVLQADTGQVLGRSFEGLGVV